MNKEQLKEISQKYADSQGFKLNEDPQMLELVLKGLLENEKKHGFRYCPCRVLEGKKEVDAKKICPCFWHKEEIKRDGHCKCQLFFGPKEE